MSYPVGKRAKGRVVKAQGELQYLRETLEAECVRVTSRFEFEETCNKEILKMKTALVECRNMTDDVRLKQKVKIYQPTPFNPDQRTTTPFWNCNYQYGTANPRDPLLILGNTVVEAPMSHRSRYFEVYSYRDIVQDLWNRDTSIKWIAAPKPSMAKSMYNNEFWYTWTPE